MSEIIIPLALAATTTGAITALKSTIQPPSSISPVLPMPILLKLRLDVTSGTGSSTVLLESSQDNSAFTTHSTVTVVTLTGTLGGYASYWCTVAAPYIRVNVSAISGTGASLTVLAELNPAGHS